MKLPTILIETDFGKRKLLMKVSIDQGAPGGSWTAITIVDQDGNILEVNSTKTPAEKEIEANGNQDGEDV